MPDAATYPRLLADIGGTHVRLARQASSGAPFTDLATLSTQEHASLLNAIRRWLADRNGPPPMAGALAIANPVAGDHVQMTNHSWSFSIAELQHALGLDHLTVVNDFTAVALALPALLPQHLHGLQEGHAIEGAALAVLGPGTGLGVSGLIPGLQGAWAPISGEGGHVSLAPGNAHESALIDVLQRRFGHASAERVLSGPGLVNLYEAGCVLRGRAPAPLTPADVVSRAQALADDACVEALASFFALLGSVAGDLALTLGARGGVFIAGGIVPRVLNALQASHFLERFSAKGRFADYLRAIPIHVIDPAAPTAFIGASRALDAAI